MNAIGQSALVVAVVSFSLGFSVLARNVKNILFIAFAGLTSLISAWAFSFFLEKVWPGYGFYDLHLLFNIWLAPMSLTFIRVMVRIRDRVSGFLLYFSFLVSAGLTLALLLHLKEVPWVLQIIYFCPALIAIQNLQLMWIDYRLKRGIARLPKIPTVGLGRKTLIYVGALMFLMTSVMDHVPWMGVILPSLGNLGLAVYLFFLSQAITQQRLLNINALFSRFLVLLVVALTLTVVYALMVAWTQNSPGLFFLNSFISSFFVLSLLDPLRTLVVYFTERLLTQKHRKLQQLLRESQRKLTSIVDLSSLAHAILGTVEQTLNPEWAALFVLTSNGKVFRRLRFIGRELEVPAPAENGSETAVEFKSNPEAFYSIGCREILAHHPILQFCANLARKGKFPVLLDQLLENEKDRSATLSQRELFTGLIEGLRALGSNLLIPLIDSGSILGFVSMRIPRPPEPWGNNWGLLPIIYPYFEHAARMMQTLEVYARRREKERLAALGEMAAGLAHEIRNPLGAIKGAAQFLDPSLDRPESKFLKIIIEEVDRLNRVVSQFLDYSKPTLVQFEVLDLSLWVEKALSRLRLALPPRMELEFQSSKLPAWVMASSEQLSQVIINLILNAQKALEKKASGGMIRVGVQIEEGGRADQNEVYLTIEDTGIGIKKENLEKIFIPFFTTSPEGTGLGLSITQKIVEAHRGRLEIASEEGRFTRMSVILPYHVPQALQP